MRRRKTEEDLEADAVARELAAMVAGKPKRARKSSTKVSEKKLDALIREVENAVESQDWSAARPALLVALFCWAHKQCYDVTATPVVRTVFVQACSAAKRLVEDEFGGDYDQAIAFMRWLWLREADREDWRRKNPSGGGMLTWYRVFVNRGVVVEYRVSQRREGVK